MAVNARQFIFHRREIRSDSVVKCTEYQGHIGKTAWEIKHLVRILKEALAKGNRGNCNKRHGTE